MKTIINIKVDKDIKDKAVKTVKKMGLPLSAVVNAFLKQFISERQVTFSVPIVPTRNLEKILIQAENDIRSKRNLSPVFTNMREMNEYLDNL